MSQMGDITSHLTTLIENGRYDDFNIACETMEIFVDYETCLEILDRVEEKAKENGDTYLQPLFQKQSFYKLMIS